MVSEGLLALLLSSIVNAISPDPPSGHWVDTWTCALSELGLCYDSYLLIQW